MIIIRRDQNGGQPQHDRDKIVIFFSAEGAYSYGFGKKLAKKNVQNLKFEFFKKCCSQPMGDLQIKRWCFAPNQRTPNPNGVVFTTCFALTLLLAY